MEAAPSCGADVPWHRMQRCQHRAEVADKLPVAQLRSPVLARDNFARVNLALDAVFHEPLLVLDGDVPHVYDGLDLLSAGPDGGVCGYGPLGVFLWFVAVGDGGVFAGNAGAGDGLVDSWAEVGHYAHSLGFFGALVAENTFDFDAECDVGGEEGHSEVMAREDMGTMARWNADT